MKIVHSLHEIPHDTAPCALTIGNFDGMHLGHQALLARLRQQVQLLKGKAYALTFLEHPSKVLSPSSAVLNLTTLQHKIKLLQEQEIDTLILLPFTKEFSQQTADEFINTLHSVLPFSALTLGHDAVIGKGRSGDRITLEDLAKKLNFQLEYLAPTLCDAVPISSSQIRQLLKKGDFPAVQQLLGRPYSIYAEVIKEMSIQEGLDFPTVNLDVKDLCLPPNGVYSTSVTFQGREEPAIANLGTSTTVHLLHKNGHFDEKKIEVTFNQFLSSQ